jgi:hypothetical protein
MNTLTVNTETRGYLETEVSTVREKIPILKNIADLPSPKVNNKIHILKNNQETKIYFENEKLKKLKDALRKNKEEKRKQASDFKNVNRLIQENLEFVKAKDKEINKQKSKLVIAGEMIRKQSIDMLQDLKFKYFKKLKDQDLERELKIFYEKQNYLNCLK